MLGGGLLIKRGWRFRAVGATLAMFGLKSSRLVEVAVTARCSWRIGDGGRCSITPTYDLTCPLLSVGASFIMAVMVLGTHKSDGWRMVSEIFGPLTLANVQKIGAGYFHEFAFHIWWTQQEIFQVRRSNTNSKISRTFGGAQAVVWFLSARHSYLLHYVWEIITSTMKQ